MISRLRASTIKTRASARFAKAGVSRRDRGRGTASRRHRIPGYLTPKSKPVNPTAFGRELSSEVCEVEQRLQTLSLDQLIERYHDLIDQRITGHIGPIQEFEISRVESRLDAEDEDELCRLAEFRKEWQHRRNELVTSIEELLTRLKGAA